MVFHPLFRADIAGDFGVEDEKTGLQFGNMSSDAFPVLFEQFSAFGLRRRATIPKSRISQHLPNRHSGRFQATEKFNPDQD
jgi:hypothetical protein